MLKFSMMTSLLMLAGPIAMASPLDNLFVRYEAQSSAYELEFARLGEARATRPDIRAYASMLVNDHEAYGEALRGLAASKGIAVSSALTSDDRTRLDSLSQTRGTAFDNAFVIEAERINHDNKESMRKEADNTADPDMHRFTDHFITVDALHEAAAVALSEHVVASKAPIINPPSTGDTIAVAPPASDNSMPVMMPPPGTQK